MQNDQLPSHDLTTIALTRHPGCTDALSPDCATDNVQVSMCALRCEDASLYTTSRPRVHGTFPRLARHIQVQELAACARILPKEWRLAVTLHDITSNGFSDEPANFIARCAQSMLLLPVLPAMSDMMESCHSSNLDLHPATEQQSAHHHKSMHGAANDCTQKQYTGHDGSCS